MSSTKKSPLNAAGWYTAMEVLNADKMSLFLYFQLYAEDSRYIPDALLEVACNTSLEVHEGTHDTLPVVSMEMN